jgi:hypothetical protein
MENNFTETKKLKSQLNELFSLYKEKNEKLIELEIKNTNLVNLLKQKESQLIELKTKQETLKVAKTLSLTEEDKTEVKNKINKIVREIDKSIGLLNE